MARDNYSYQKYKKELAKKKKKEEKMQRKLDKKNAKLNEEGIGQAAAEKKEGEMNGDQNVAQA